MRSHLTLPLKLQKVILPGILLCSFSIFSNLSAQNANQTNTTQEEKNIEFHDRENLKEAKEFLTNRIQDPEYLKRCKTIFPEKDTADINLSIRKACTKINEENERFVKTQEEIAKAIGLKLSPISNIKGAYFPNKDTIYFVKNVTPFTSLHEETHKSSLDYYFTKYIEKFINHDTIKRIHYPFIGKGRKREPGDTTDYDGNIRSIASPREIYPRIMVLRKELKLRPGEKITRERLDNIYDIITRDNTFSSDSKDLIKGIFPRDLEYVGDQSNILFKLINELP